MAGASILVHPSAGIQSLLGARRGAGMILKAGSFVYNAGIKAMEFAETVPLGGTDDSWPLLSAQEIFFVGREHGQKEEATCRLLC